MKSKYRYIRKKIKIKNLKGDSFSKELSHFKSLKTLLHNVVGRIQHGVCNKEIYFGKETVSLNSNAKMSMKRHILLVFFMKYDYKTII